MSGPYTMARDTQTKGLTGVDGWGSGRDGRDLGDLGKTWEGAGPLQAGRVKQDRQWAVDGGRNGKPRSGERHMRQATPSSPTPIT